MDLIVFAGQKILGREEVAPVDLSQTVSNLSKPQSLKTLSTCQDIKRSSGSFFTVAQPPEQISKVTLMPVRLPLL